MSHHILDDRARLTLHKQLVDLSLRLSKIAPTIKPFLRFPRDPALMVQTQRFWDFDHLVQVQLAKLRRALASAEEIVSADIRQWVDNLTSWEQGAQILLRKAQMGDANAQHTYSDTTLTPREQLTVDTLGAGAQLLYVGAGTGKECLRFAGHGLRTVGIDTLDRLLSIGQKWATLLARDVRLIGMDLMALGFTPGIFDGVLLEFYGSWPAYSQSLQAQRSLARILTPEGRGFIVAARKHYPSYWYMISAGFSPAMVDYLAPQTALDFHYTARDEAVERQVYGLFYKAHTAASLQDELSASFVVHACRVLDDPRYLVAEVQPRQDVDFSAPLPNDGAAIVPLVHSAIATTITHTLDLIAALVEMLEDHTARMTKCFEAGCSGTECFKTLDVDIASIVALLEQIVPETMDNS
ncbi:MAG: class I SAM-dependent methyltransferase [Anaerolineae bacterium]|nr:class I SAM-dependent methyltransferase [Anaerolineae bacterium]